MILPYKRQIPSLVDLTEAEHEDLADVLRRYVPFLCLPFVPISFLAQDALLQNNVRLVQNASTCSLLTTLYSPLSDATYMTPHFLPGQTHSELILSVAL